MVCLHNIIIPILMYSCALVQMESASISASTGLGLGTGNGFYSFFFFFVLKSDKHLCLALLAKLEPGLKFGDTCGNVI